MKSLIALGRLSLVFLFAAIFVASESDLHITAKVAGAVEEPTRVVDTDWSRTTNVMLDASTASTTSPDDPYWSYTSDAWDGASTNGSGVPIPGWEPAYWSFLPHAAGGCTIPTPATHQWLRTTLNLPSVAGITKIELIGLFHEPTGNIGINDNLYVWINSPDKTLDRIAAYGGTSSSVGGFPAVLTTRLPPPPVFGGGFTETDGWNIQPLPLPVGLFNPGTNNIDILREEFCSWGGVSHLAFRLTITDSDGDGIPDAQDACPNEPEDFDGFQDGDGCPDITTLTTRFAPELILMNGARCSDDWKQRQDPYEPERVEILATPSRVMRDGGRSDRGWAADAELVGNPLPSIDVLGQYSEEDDQNVYVDIVGHGPRDETACEDYGELYDSLKNSFENVTYVAFAEEGTSEANKVVRLTYWFFYFFDDWSGNKHEGDWEKIILEFHSIEACSFDSIPTLVANNCHPTMALYSQHFLPPQSRDWNHSDFFKRDQTHPISFVATGSHANYFEPGRTTLIGGADWSPRDPLRPELGKPEVALGRRVSVLTGNLTVERLGCPDDPPWLPYAGRWGEDVNLQKLRFSGPHADLCGS